MDWFSSLTGFAESDYEATRAQLAVRGDRLHSLANGRSYAIGRLVTPALAELRAHAEAAGPSVRGRLNVRVIRADVRHLHGSADHAGALFQVASQFNLLEMTGPSVTPEMGVTRYAHDRTQGPACAMAAGAATLYRNYFAPAGGVAGQTSSRQIDCLDDVARLLGNEAGRLWNMRNGYALCTDAGLQDIGDRLRRASPDERDAIRAALRIGVHEDVEITDGAQTGHLVTQAFCSALPVAYSRAAPGQWEPFARLVLEAAYEATLLAGAVNAARTGNREVFLTMLGGGAFGNDLQWIVDAMARAFRRAEGLALDVHIVSHGPPPPVLTRLVASVE